MSKQHPRWLVVIAAGLAVAGGAIVALLLFIGPHMESQLHIIPFQATAVEPAPGTIPVEGNDIWPERDSNLLKPPQSANAMAGRAYYSYYCIFCHGDIGDGNGPVGQSIVPEPADLRDQRIMGWSDSQLVYAMLNGEGHTVERNGVRKPVLERIIPPGQIPGLVEYVRTFQQANARK